VTNLLSQARYITIIGVLSLLLTSMVAFCWGALKAIKVIAVIITSYGQDSHIAIYLVEVVDVMLIATVLLISATSIYDIFIEKLPIRDGMVAHNLYELKSKLSSMMILVMAAKFLEHLVEWGNAMDTLLYGLAVSAVSATLIALSYVSSKE